MSKKILPLLVLLSMSLSLFAGYTFAAPGAGCKREQDQQKQQMDAETKKKYDAFMAETVALRKELEEKAMAYQVIMASDKPDPKKAALISEEYYQLREFIQNKAIEAGIVQKRRGCNGCPDGKQGVACGLPGGKAKEMK